MSPVATGTTLRPARSGPVRARRRPSASAATLDGLFDRSVDGQTLDDVLVGAWEDLSAHRTVACPVCHGAAMRPRYGSGQVAGGTAVVGGRCADCGSVLG